MTHEEMLLNLAQSLATGNKEEVAAAEVLCLLGACLRKGSVRFVFGEHIKAARAEAERSKEATWGT